MLGEFASRVLLLIVGYAYPAFECFKTLEMKEVRMEQLRFWCQYWVIVAFLTVFETFSDALASWLPMYSELKLGFFIYLWYPKTQGTCFVYDKVLQPYVIRYEPELEEKVQVLMAKLADLLRFYINNFTDKGPSKVLEFVHSVISQPSRLAERNQGPGLTGHLGAPAIQRSAKPVHGGESRFYDDRDVVEYAREDFIPDAHAHAHERRTWNPLHKRRNNK